MKLRHRTKFVYTAATLLTMGTLALTTVPAAAVTGTPTSPATHLANIISKGDQEITRRLNSLNSLSGKISAATRLSASDKSTLSDEVATEISGLTALKTKLDAETTVSGAAADVSSMVSEYRVYALVVPKVMLVKTADDQQVVETKLSALATKLGSRISAAQASGKNVTTVQAELSDMQSKTAAAQTISASIEASVILLQPSDYDSNHAILSGDAAQLKTAHSDNEAAATDAKNIVTALKSL